MWKFGKGAFLILSVIIKGLNTKSQTTDGLPYIFLDLDCGSKIEARKTVVEWN